MHTTSLLGVLAFGDSITNGGGELQWGVALQSWALWTARGLGLPYTGYATDGARARDVVGRQIPAFERSASDPHGRYDVGALYIGVNDVRSLDWDAGEFAAQFAAGLAFLTARCVRTLALTAPLDLGRPRAGAKVHELNAVVDRLARTHGALIVDLADFGARNHVMADHVHPTAFGQIAIAQRGACSAGPGRHESQGRSSRHGQLRDDQVEAAPRRPHIRLPAREGDRPVAEPSRGPSADAGPLMLPAWPESTRCRPSSSSATPRRRLAAPTTTCCQNAATSRRQRSSPA